MSQYHISSAANNVLVADVAGGNSNPGTNVLVYTNLVPFAPHQLWRLIAADDPVNMKKFAIQSALGDNVYAAVDSANPGQEVKTSNSPTIWEVTPASAPPNGTPGVWIKLPNTDLVWTIPAGASPQTKITIMPTGSPIPEQKWILNSVN